MVEWADGEKGEDGSKLEEKQAVRVKSTTENIPPSDLVVGRGRQLRNDPW